MRQILNDADRALIEKHIREAEIRTGVQIVFAVTKRSDCYTELPWKAFAFGVSVTGLAVFFLLMFTSVWITKTTILLSVSSILVTGTAIALLTLLFPGFARLFLSGSRKETEPLQYAESLFLSHELFASEGRRGFLMLISKFERQIVILPDTGVKKLLSDDAMKNIISGMKIHLRRNELRSAMETGLEKLVETLLPPATEGPDKNELPELIIDE